MANYINKVKKDNVEYDINDSRISSLTGQAGKVIAVNEDENEFVAIDLCPVLPAKFFPGQSVSSSEDFTEEELMPLIKCIGCLEEENDNYSRYNFTYFNIDTTTIKIVYSLVEYDALGQGNTLFQYIIEFDRTTKIADISYLEI